MLQYWLQSIKTNKMRDRRILTTLRNSLSHKENKFNEYCDYNMTFCPSCINYLLVSQFLKINLGMPPFSYWNKRSIDDSTCIYSLKQIIFLTEITHLCYLRVCTKVGSTLVYYYYNNTVTVNC